MSNTRKTTAPRKTAPKKAAAPPAAPPEEPTEDIHALLTDPDAGPPESTVRLCLRANLQAEWEELVARLDELQVEQLHTMVERAERRKVAERITELERKMRAATVPFRFRANRGEFARLREEHPPRKGEDGKVHPHDALGVNSETFFDPLIRVMCVSPTLSDEEWTQLLGGEIDGTPVDARLSDGQLDQMWQAAWSINRGKADVPFSRAASRMMTTSESESRQPANSGSRSAASRAGNRAR